MIVCPNCNHQNPDGAQVCEACYTELPELTTCPNCGAGVQQDATFCGQCGSALNLSSSTNSANLEEENPLETPIEIPKLVTLEPLIVPEEIATTEIEPAPSSSILPSTEEEETINPITELQQETASLIHISTDRCIPLPTHLPVLQIGKPNDQNPPDIDVSGFPDADVVSRVHAALRLEAGVFYLEDLGSSNGTYVNHLALSPGTRHRLKGGDRITLGKNDLVTFIFQIS